MRYVRLTKEKSRRLPRRVLSISLSAALAVNSLLAGMPIFNTQVASAATAFNNGFEVDTNGWEINSTGTISRVASGTNGISSADGSYYANVEGDSFTRFGGYESVFPANGYTASVDVYLDPSWAVGSGFDYSVASNGTNGNHRRDFIFHVAKDTSTNELLVGASNNSTNVSINENLEATSHYQVTTAGWYTLQHHFYNNGGQLTVDLNLLNTPGATLFTKTLSTATDTIPAVVGGHRYGWFTFVNVAGGLALDNSSLETAYITPELNAEEFVTVDGSYKGVSVGFNASHFGTVSAVTVDVTRADDSHVIKTGNQGLFDLISNQTGPVQLTAPIVIQEGTFTEASDTTYWDPAPAAWTTSTEPTSVTITVTDENGPVSVTNSIFNQGAPSWPTFASILPAARNATDNLNFSSIQAAIDAPTTDNGEVIEAYDGVHGSFATSFDGDTDLTIQPFGTATPIIEASTTGSSRIVDLRADGTTFKGFTVRSLTPGANVGISMSGQDLTIQDNTIEDTLTGIQTTTQYNVGSSLIQNNVINSTYGISLQNDSNTVIKNDITSMVEGFGVIGLNNIIELNNVQAISGNQAVAYGGIALNVVKNWWGSQDEPTAIVGNVTYDPWLCQSWQTSTSTVSVNGSCDLEAPTAPTITAPADGSYHTSTPIKAIWTTATDNSTITNYQIAYRYDDGHTFNGSTCPVGEIVDGQVISGCRTIGNVLSRNHVPNVSEQGGVTIWVRAIDEYGNEGDWSEPVHYFYDETAPTVSGVVLNGQNVTVARTVNCGSTDFNLVSGKIDLNATISDNIDVHNARYKIRKVTNGGCTQTAIYQSNTVNMQDSGSNQWITLPGAQIDTATAVGLVDGNYTIQITAKDEAGNMSTSYVDITVDNTAPDKVEGIQIEFNGQNRQCAGFINGRTITVNWNDSNEPGVVYEYHNKDRSLLNNLTESEFTGDIRDQDGFYQYKVRAIDAAGNAGEWSDWCGVTLDREAPVAPTLTSPDNAAVVNGMSISQSWSTTDTDIDHYIYESYNDELGHNLRWHETFNSTSKTAFNVSESTYWWRVQAVDNAGNVGPWSAMWKIIVDNTVPTVEVTTHEDGDVISGLVTVIGLVNDSNPGHNWFVVTDEDGNQVAGIGVNNDTTPSFDWNTASVSDGLYIIKLEARDAAGNKDPNGTGLVDDNGISVDWTVVTVDNTNPVVTVDLDDTTINTDDSDNPSVTISATDATSGVDYVQYKVMDESGDTVLGWVTIDNNTPTEVPGVLGLADGEYTLRARAFDSAGNKKSGADISFTVDNTIPTLTLASIDSNSDTSRTITGTGEPEASIMVEVHSAPQTWNGTIAGDGTWSHTFTGLEEGSHTVNATSTDAAGNISMQSSTFTVLAAVNTNTGGQTLGAKDSRNTTPTPTEAKKAGSVLAAITELPGTGAATSAFAFVGALTLMAGAALALRRRKTS